jgi:hypothetical protein
LLLIFNLFIIIWMNKIINTNKKNGANINFTNQSIVNKKFKGGIA